MIAQVEPEGSTFLVTVFACIAGAGLYGLICASIGAWWERNRSANHAAEIASYDEQAVVSEEGPYEEPDEFEEDQRRRERWWQEREAAFAQRAALRQERRNVEHADMRASTSPRGVPELVASENNPNPGSDMRISHTWGPGRAPKIRLTPAAASDTQVATSGSGNEEGVG